MRTDCGSSQNLTQAGLGLSIPNDVKTLEALREEFWLKPGNAFLLEDSAETRAKIADLESAIGRELSELEAQLILLVTSGEDALSVLGEVRTEQIRQGKTLEVLADPAIQEELLKRALMSVQRDLDRQRIELEQWYLSSEYRDIDRMEVAAGIPNIADGTPLTDEIKQKLKAEIFKRSVSAITTEHNVFRSYSDAAQTTLLLIGALSDSPSFQSDVKKAFVAVNSVNDMIKPGLFTEIGGIGCVRLKSL